MAGVDFSDRKAAEKWLKTQSVEVRCAIASRAALRVCANIGWSESNSQKKLALVVFRATLTSAVRGLGRTADVQWLTRSADSAANSANSAAYSAAFSANSAAYSAAYSANSAANSANSAAYSANSAANSANSAANSAAYDTQNPSVAEFDVALWPTNDIPPSIAENHQKFLVGLSANRKIWSFWHDWYLGMWEGTFRDWDFATEVAKIPDEVWNEGAEAIAEEINNLEAQRLIITAGISEAFELDKETSKFDVVPHIQSNQAVLEVAVSRSEDALDDVFVLSKGNGLTQNTVEALILLRLFQRYRSDPRRVAFDFAEVGRSIAANIKAGEYPEDSPLKTLQSTLTIGINEIFAIEPDIQAELERSFPKKVEEPPSEVDVLVLIDAMEILPELSQNLLERQLGEDIIEVLYGEVVDYENLPDVGSFRPATTTARLSVRRRLASRIARLYSETRMGLQSHYDSATFRQVRVIGTYGGILGFLAAALGAVARLLL